MGDYTSTWGMHNFVSKLDSIAVLGSIPIPCRKGWGEGEKTKGSEVNPATMVAQVQIRDLEINCTSAKEKIVLFLKKVDALHAHSDHLPFLERPSLARSRLSYLMAVFQFSI